MPASMTLPDLASATANSGVRSSALANWQATGWPGPRVESWRFTKLALLEGQTFAPAHDLPTSQQVPAWMRPHRLARMCCAL